MHFIGMHPSRHGMVLGLAPKVAPGSWLFPRCGEGVMGPDHRRGSSSLRSAWVLLYGFEVIADSSK